MKIRHQGVRQILTALAFTLGMGLAGAQSFPSRQISIVVPWPAGGATDMSARLVAPELQALLGQTVIVENPVGAGGSIGTTKALAAPPDGHTLISSSQQEMVMATMVYKSAAYRPDDARAVALVAHTSLMLVVRKELPAANLGEFAALLKTAAKPLSYCTPGQGTVYPLVVEKFSSAAQAKALHVPYPGFGQCLNDLAGGVVDFAVVPIAGPFPGFVDNGSVRALAVFSDTPSPRLPKVPSVTTIKGFEALHMPLWGGFHVSAKTPDAVVDQLNKAIYAALAKPEVRKALESSGATLFPPMTAKQANDYYLKDARELENLGKTMGMSKQ